VDALWGVIMTPADAQVIWTDYLRYRAHTRGFDRALIEQLLRELSPTITAELNAQGEVIGIEILQASAFVREALQDLAHAQRLKLSPTGK
jgi:hypothetical protein